jgi:ribosomal protein S18 acetylase RimI-like enzyme
MQLETFVFERDFDQVIRLWGEAGPGIQLSPSDSPEGIKKKLARDPDLFLVAHQGGELLGAVLGGFDGRRGMVYHLAVRQPDRQRGVGRALMDELESRLRAKGCLKYYLLVTRDNLQAVAFYEQLGWEMMPLSVMGKVIT